MKKLIMFLFLCCTLTLFSYNFLDVTIDLPENFRTEEFPEQLIFSDPESRLIGSIYISTAASPIPMELLYTELEKGFLKITYFRKNFEENWFVLNGIVGDKKTGEKMMAYVKCLHEDGGTMPRMLLIYTPLDETEYEQTLIAQLSKSFQIIDHKFWTSTK